AQAATPPRARQAATIAPRTQAPRYLPPCPSCSRFASRAPTAMHALVMTANPPPPPSPQRASEAPSDPLATPMMQQYLDAKAACPGALVMMRMGDFYELFLDDAVEAAALLDLTLTARNKKDDNPIPMAGVPHHALDAYLPRLLSAGKKVA